MSRKRRRGSPAESFYPLFVGGIAGSFSPMGVLAGVESVVGRDTVSGGARICGASLCAAPLMNATPER